MSDEEAKTLPDQDQESDVGEEQAEDATQSDTSKEAADSGKKTEEAASETKTIVEPTVPDKYEFKVPHNVNLDAKMVRDFAAFAREKKLTQEEAQKVIDMQVEASKGLFKELENQEKQVRGEMKQRIKEDPVLSRQENLAFAARAIDGYGSKMQAEERKEFKEWLDNGPGDYLPLARFLYFIGKDISDDILVLGDEAQNTKDKGEKQLKSMYPTSFK